MQSGNKAIMAQILCNFDFVTVGQLASPMLACKSVANLATESRLHASILPAVQLAIAMM